MSTHDPEDITLGGATLHRETMHASIAAVSAKPAFTIVMHSDADRVGDVYRLSSAPTEGCLEIARRTPEFRSPRTGRSLPLACGRACVKLQPLESIFLVVQFPNRTRMERHPSAILESKVDQEAGRTTFHSRHRVARIR